MSPYRTIQNVRQTQKFEIWQLGKLPSQQRMSLTSYPRHNKWVWCHTRDIKSYPVYNVILESNVIYWSCPHRSLDFWSAKVPKPPTNSFLFLTIRSILHRLPHLITRATSHLLAPDNLPPSVDWYLHDVLILFQVLRSIGYKSHKLEHTMPFDVIAGVVPNKMGRVEGHPGEYIYIYTISHAWSIDRFSNSFKLR